MIIDCPIHEGHYDCSPFCNVCEGEQEYELDIESHRKIWAKVATDNNWGTDPLYVQVWVSPDTGKIWDSVSFSGMTGDIVVIEREWVIA